MSERLELFRLWTSLDDSSRIRPTARAGWKQKPRALSGTGPRRRCKQPLPEVELRCGQSRAFPGKVETAFRFGTGGPRFRETRPPRKLEHFIVSRNGEVVEPKADARSSESTAALVMFRHRCLIVKQTLRGLLTELAAPRCDVC